MQPLNEMLIQALPFVHLFLLSANSAHLTINVKSFKMTT